ncbi:GSCOCG00004208001-RA-CDS [Cotesia congregata]|nr:GSCOCG00004208001-RA-CDS [Cotesia congregata]
MSSELDSTAEINSTYPGPGYPRPSGVVVVRAEEALIVVFVLLLWVGAIALFFNRWGKIRMLEPYQPKFQQHRNSCTSIDPPPLRSCSKFNIHCVDHSQCQAVIRPRQNSVFVDSSVSMLSENGNFPRRTRSAVNLQSFGKTEGSYDLEPGQIEEVVEPEEEIVPVMNLKSLNDYSKPSRSFQRERGMSICQFDRTDVLVRPLQRERGMSICHFDRMDVLARPLLRDKGMSICHFDRTDVLARPLCRPLTSRPGVLTNAEKLEALGKSQCHRDSRTSIGNAESFTKILHQRSKDFRAPPPALVSLDRAESLALPRNSAPASKEKTATFKTTTATTTTTTTTLTTTTSINTFTSTTISPYDRPSCSKTPDIVLGYKATCV